MDQEKPDAGISARLLQNAQAVTGSGERLAFALGVELPELSEWLGGMSVPPQDVIERLLEIVLEGTKPTQPRILIADSPAACEAVIRVLGEGLDFVCVHTTASAQEALRKGGIDVIVCGQHFDGSQMLQFLQTVKGDERTRAIPFLCCRAMPTHLGAIALAAVREACEALGAAAYIDLPERERKEGVEAAAVEFRDAVRGAARLPQNSGHLRVLVADDNADAAHTLSAILQMAGYQVLKAKDGVEALKLALREHPDALILDIGMPKLSGYDVAERLRGDPWGKTAMLIALTAYGDREHVERAHQSGFNHHFRKPVTVEDLFEVLPKQASAD